MRMWHIGGGGGGGLLGYLGGWNNTVSEAQLNGTRSTNTTFNDSTVNMAFYNREASNVVGT